MTKCSLQERKEKRLSLTQDTAPTLTLVSLSLACAMTGKEARGGQRQQLLSFHLRVLEVKPHLSSLAASTLSHLASPPIKQNILALRMKSRKLRTPFIKLDVTSAVCCIKSQARALREQLFSAPQGRVLLSSPAAGWAAPQAAQLVLSLSRSLESSEFLSHFLKMESCINYTLGLKQWAWLSPVLTAWVF